MFVSGSRGSGGHVSWEQSPQRNTRGQDRGCQGKERHKRDLLLAVLNPSSRQNVFERTGPQLHPGAPDSTGSVVRGDGQEAVAWETPQLPLRGRRPTSAHRTVLNQHALSSFKEMGSCVPVCVSVSSFALVVKAYSLPLVQRPLSYLTKNHLEGYFCV